MDEITLTHQELAARRTAHGTTFYIEVDEDIALRDRQRIRPQFRDGASPRHVGLASNR